MYTDNQLDFDLEENRKGGQIITLPKDEPDYWEKLHHQAAIAAMQGVLSNTELLIDTLRDVSHLDKPQYLADKINDYTTALIKKLKNEK